MDKFKSKGAFSVNEFLEWAGIGRTSCYAEIAAGRLKASKFGHKTLIKYEHAQEWLNRLPEAAA